MPSTMRIEKPFKMRNVTTFPIERLCLYLRVEVLEQLPAELVISLVKVNQRFRWMISSRPSIVFGHHVANIHLRFSSDEIRTIKIEKLNHRSVSISLDVLRHFPFIKNIRSCYRLWVHNENGFEEDYVAFLKQLKAVDQLWLFDCTSQDLELVFHLSIKEFLYLDIRFPRSTEEARSTKDLVEHFIEPRLNECEEVVLWCDPDDSFYFYYNISVKTHTKHVAFSLRPHYGNLIFPAIQWIVSRGVPSKNPAAVVVVVDQLFYGMEAAILVFLRGYPGMKEISRENRHPFIGLANDRLMETKLYTLNIEALCFRRSINATIDCIYILSTIRFFAYYIQPDEMTNH